MKKTTKMNLRKARKFEGKVDNLIGNIEINPTEKVEIGNIANLIDSELGLFLEMISDKQVKRIDDTLFLLDIKFKIRSLIAAKNFKSGISELMTQRQELIKNIDLLDTLNHPWVKQSSATAVRYNVKSIVENKNINEQYINVGNLNSGAINIIKFRLKTARVDLEALDEKIYLLNSTETVNIPNSLIEFVNRLL